MSTKSRMQNRNDGNGLPHETKEVVPSSPKLLPSPMSANRRRKKLGKSNFWPRSNNHNIMPTAPSLAPIEASQKAPKHTSRKSLFTTKISSDTHSRQTYPSTTTKEAESTPPTRNDGIISPEDDLPSNESSPRPRTSSDNTSSTQNESSSSSTCSQERISDTVEREDTTPIGIYEPASLQKTLSSPATLTKETSRNEHRRDAPSSLRRPSLIDDHRIPPQKKLVRRNSAGKLQPKQKLIANNEDRVPLARRVVRSLSAGKLMQRQAPVTDISAARDLMRSASAGKLAKRGKSSERKNNEKDTVPLKLEPTSVGVNPSLPLLRKQRRRNSNTLKPPRDFVDLTMEIRSSNSIDAPVFEPSLIRAKESENGQGFSTEPTNGSRKRNTKRRSNKSPVVDISLLYNKRDDSPPRSQLERERKPPERTMSADETILSEVERLCCNLSASSEKGQTFSVNGKLILETDDCNLTDDESLISDDEDGVDTSSDASESDEDLADQGDMPRSPSPAPPEIQQDQKLHPECENDSRRSVLDRLDKLQSHNPENIRLQDQVLNAPVYNLDVNRSVKFAEELSTCYEYPKLDDIEDLMQDTNGEAVGGEAFAPRYIIDHLKSIRKAECNLALVRIIHSFEDRNAMGRSLEDLKGFYEVEIPKSGQKVKKGTTCEMEGEYLRGLECFLCDSYGDFQRQHRSSILLAQKRQWRKLSKQAMEKGLEKSNELPDLRKASMKTSRPLRHAAIQMARYDAKQSLSALLTKWE